MFLKANSLPSGGAHQTLGQLDLEVRRVWCSPAIPDEWSAIRK
jgi:hypothetical protein